MKRLMVAALVAPYVVELVRVGWAQANRWFDAWFAAQLRKAWRPGPRSRW